MRAVTWTEGAVEQAMIFGVLREYNLVPTGTEGVLERRKMHLHRASRDWGQLLRAHCDQAWELDLAQSPA